MFGDVVGVAIIQFGDLFLFAFEQEQKHLFEPFALEQFQSTRTQPGAFDAQPALLVEQSVVFHLITEHRRIAAVELKLDAFG
jgi:hypothetical protein